MPSVDQSGVSVITVTVEDAGLDYDLANSADNAIFSRSFTVTVYPVNDIPSLDAINNVTITEDAPQQTINLTGISAGGGESQTLRVLAISSNTTLIPNPSVSYASPNAIGSMVFSPLANQSGTVTITVTVEDSGLDNNLNTPADNLAFTCSFVVTVTQINDLPVAQASSAFTLEDTPRTFAISDFLYSDVENDPLESITITGLTLATGDSLKFNGVAVTTPLTIPAANISTLIHTPATNANGAARSKFTFKVNDADLGSVVATMNINVTQVNDAPIRSAGSPAAINVNVDAANTTAVPLGLSGLNYGPGGSSDESTQTLTYKLTSIPAFIMAWLSDGTTQILANSSLTLTQLRGLKYKTVTNANGTANLTWTVQDNGGTVNGGIDLLPQSLSITVNAINDIPARSSGTTNLISVSEDSANSVAVTLGLSGLSYTPGGGSDEATQTMTYKVTTLPSFMTAWLLDGTTQVLVNSVLTLNQLQGLQYKTVANANGAGNLIWTVQDNGGTANEGFDTLIQSVCISVIAVNDAPIQSGIFPAAISVNKNSANITAVSLGLSGLNYGPGGGCDESSQNLTYKITAIPSFITVWRSNGTKQVLVNESITLADLKGLRYKTVSNAVGTGNLTWTVKDSGGVANGGIDSLQQNLSITVASNLELSGQPASNLISGYQDNRLTISVLNSMAEQVKSLWFKEGFDISILTNLQIMIADLPGGTLGHALGSVITIDRDAAGHGWFIDLTPDDSVEFNRNLAVSTDAIHHVDLLSVLSHEIGHVLGLEHDSTYDVMKESLPIGKRILPTDDPDSPPQITSLAPLPTIPKHSSTSLHSNLWLDPEEWMVPTSRTAQIDVIFADWSNRLSDTHPRIHTPTDSQTQLLEDELVPVAKKKRLLSSKRLN